MVKLITYCSLIILMFIPMDMIGQSISNIENSKQSLGKEWQKGGNYDGFSPEQEIIEKRTPISKTFRNSDGSFTSTFVGLAHYKDENGMLKDVDYTIKKNNSSTRPEHEYLNTTAQIKSYFSGKPGEVGVLMVVDKLEFSWWKHPELSLISSNNEVLYTRKARKVKGELNENVLTYKESYLGIDEEFVILEDGWGIENNTIINYLNSNLITPHTDATIELTQFVPLEGKWKIYSGNDEMNSDFNSNGFSLLKVGESKRIYFNPIVIFDSKLNKRQALKLLRMPAERITAETEELRENHVSQGKYKVRFVAGGLSVTVAVPQDWFLKKELVFPLTIDPTITVGAETQGWDLLWDGYWADTRGQNLLLSSDLTGGGMSNGDIITAIELKASTVWCGGNQTGLKIRIQSTAATTSPAFINSGYTNCYSGSQNLSGGTGWYMHTFSTTFAFNSANNVLIDFTQNMAGYNCFSWDDYWWHWVAGANRSAYNTWASDIGDPQTNTTEIADTDIPYMRITYTGPSGPPGDAYAIFSPDALGGSASGNELSATAGTGGTDGLVYANSSEVGSSVAVSGYPTITAENINCLNSNIDFTTTGTNPSWTDLGSNATLCSAPCAIGSSTINNNQYSATTGRRTIDLTSDIIGPCGPNGTKTFSRSPGYLGFEGCAWRIEDVITVSGACGNINTADITVTLNISHTYVSDLVIKLNVPNGDQIDLIAVEGGSGDNIINTKFNDGAASSIVGQSAPFTGTWRPEGSIGSICGWTSNQTTFGAIGGGSMSPNGSWRLIIVDLWAGDNPTLNSWSIEFQDFPEIVTVPTSRTYTDFINMGMDIPTAAGPTGNTPLCAGVTANYASPDAGTPGYVYSWSAPTVGTQTAPVIATNTASNTDITFSNASGSDIVYTVYLDITSECCGPLAQVSKTITVNPVPNPEPTAVVDASPSACIGSTVTMAVSSPNANYNYEWYTVSTGGTSVATSPTYDVTAASGTTNYYVEAVTSDGCKNLARTLVAVTGTDTPPTVPNPTSGCGPGLYTASVSSPTAGAIYNWYSDAGLTILLQSGVATTYEINAASTPTLIYVTESAPGCNTTSSTTVTVTYTGTTAVTWDGSSSTDWFTAANWTPPCVPDAGIDATIANVGVVCDISFANGGGDANCKSITINGSATLLLGDTKAALNIYSNWTNNGTFTPNVGLVTFTGTAAQSTSGSATLFYNLTIDKSSGTVTLGTDLSVSNNLNLLDGELDINNNKITVTNTSTSAIGRVDGYIVSEGMTSFLQWNTDAAIRSYEFPFGSGGEYIPFTFTKNAATASNIEVATWGTSVDNQTMIPTGTTLLAALGTSNFIDRWWEVTPSVWLSGDLTFKWKAAETGAVDYTTDPMSYHWDGSAWEWISGTASTNSITATWTSYSGGGGGGGPLPIDLWYFDAVYNPNTEDVDLNWATVSETNNEFFTVEKSQDGTDFDLVVKVPGAGTTTQTLYYDAVDEEPYLGLSYYRLKQTDYDGEFQYSELVAVNILEDLQFAVWPNPAKDNLEITFGNASKNKVFVMTPDYKAQIRIFDSEGRVVYSKKFEGTFYKFNIDISGFNQGMYIATLVANDKLYKAKFVKE